MEHNKKVEGTPEPSAEDYQGSIVLLLRDGRVFGPFPSRHAAMYWCAAMELDGYSTYELINPGAHHEDP